MKQHATVPGPDHTNPQDDDTNPQDDGGGPADAAGAATSPANLNRAVGRSVVLMSDRPDGRRRSGARGRGRVPGAVLAWHERGRRARAELAEVGMATAEYAIATLAAVGFAGLLVVILKGNEVKGLLLGIVRQALSL